MACALGIEQSCSECRMCGNGKGVNKMTNFERIKGMSVEELADLLVVFDGEEDRYNYISASTKKSLIYSSSYSLKEALREQIKWLESECDVEC